MTDKIHQQPPAPISGEDVFAEVTSLSKKQITEMLVRTIDSASDYHGWSLSEEDAERMVKLIKHKQRVICSSFAFQLNRHFSDFKAADGSQSRDQGRHDWQGSGLSRDKDSAEIEALEHITTRYI